MLFTELMKSMNEQDAKLSHSSHLFKGSLHYIVDRSNGARPGLCNNVNVHNEKKGHSVVHNVLGLGHIVKLSRARILVWQSVYTCDT